MICSLHIGLNRFLLLTVGLWPYQQSKLVQFQLILFFSILTTFISFQFTTFMTSQCTPDLVINVLSSILFFFTFMIKYSCFSINTEVIKYLLEQLQHICNELTDENEINIIKQYASNAKRYTATFMLLAIVIASLLLLYPIWPCIFDILLPINETRPRPSPLFATEYFVDQERYFYLIILHANAAFVIGGVAMLATATIIIFYLQHACGMFRIASYRFKRAITTETLQKNSLKHKNLIYKELIYAVDMHRKAMKFSDSTISKFKVMFFLLIVAGVICASMNFFRMFHVMYFEYNTSEFFLRLIYIVVHMSYLFAGNYLAQEVIDHNNDIFVTVYNVQWYVAPLQVQKMILFLLQRGTKVFNLNIAGLFVGSLEGAATVRKMSFKICVEYEIFFKRRKIENSCFIIVIQFHNIVFHYSLFHTELT
ncbi:uncharacterized protein LOC105198336 isoform X2 [Solenopsis invicta]|uniref:uncharacterized protein LOC105198336 isoform X2 n=1 Tax=Solenopsis invicta TaxID=13686 RepID=UPI00193E863A|nr:uncharacterized protein LOC105198336 isoform X2 [Solenopsis invicta]